MKNNFFSPVMDDDKLKEIHQGLKLTREFDEPGLSMIVHSQTKKFAHGN